MKRQVLIGTIFAAALSVGSAAQTPTQTPAQPPTQTPPQTPTATASQSSGRQQTITVTGCLQEGNSATATSGTSTGAGAGTGAGTPTSGTTAAGKGSSSRKSGGDDFILTNATMGPSTGAGTGAGTGTSGAAATGGTGGSASQYRLTGKKDDLKKYANSKVEIRGRLENERGGSSSGSSSGEGPRLHVESVRQISASCSGGN